VKKRSEGLSVFLVDIRAAQGKGMEIRPLKAMVNHNTTEIFFDNLEVPAENLIGEEGQGLRYIMDGMNAERILVASEAVGDGRWFLKKAVGYAKEYDVERKWRETRLMQIAPISTNLILAFLGEHVLGMPRSY